MKFENQVPAAMQLVSSPHSRHICLQGAIPLARVGGTLASADGAGAASTHWITHVNALPEIAAYICYR